MDEFSNYGVVTDVFLKPGCDPGRLLPTNVQQHMESAWFIAWRRCEYLLGRASASRLFRVLGVLFSGGLAGLKERLACLAMHIS